MTKLASGKRRSRYGYRTDRGEKQKRISKLRGARFSHATRWVEGGLLCVGGNEDRLAT